MSIINDLRDDLTPGFRVTPQLAFSNHKVAPRRHEKVVHVPRWGWQLHAHGDNASEAGLDLRDRECLGEPVDQPLKPVLPVAVTVLIISDRGQCYAVKNACGAYAIEPVDKKR